MFFVPTRGSRPIPFRKSNITVHPTAVPGLGRRRPSLNAWNRSSNWFFSSRHSWQSFLSWILSVPIPGGLTAASRTSASPPLLHRGHDKWRRCERVRVMRVREGIRLLAPQPHMDGRMK